MTESEKPVEFERKLWMCDESEIIGYLKDYVREHGSEIAPASFLDDSAYVFFGNEYDQRHIEFIKDKISEACDYIAREPYIKASSELITNQTRLWQELFTLTSILIVGEDRKKEMLFLTALCKEHNFILGPSSVGKTHLKKQIRKLFPDGWVVDVGELSDKALKHIDWEGDFPEARVLCMDEWAGISDDVDKQIRLLSGDDGGMTSATTYTDPKTGHYKTQFDIMPQLGLITTTTRLSVNIENMTRAWSIVPDSSEDQTKRIHRRDNNFARYPHRKPVLETRLQVWHEGLRLINVDRWRDPTNGKFLVAQPVIGIVDFPTKIVRMRRDRSKVERLAAMITIMNQYDRLSYTYCEREYLIGTLWDLRMAIWLSEGIFEDTVSGMTERHRKVFDTIKTIELNKVANKEGPSDDIPSLETTAHNISKQILDLSQDQCYRAAEDLVEKGYLLKSKGEGRGNPNIYNVKQEPEFKLSVDVDKAEDMVKEWIAEMGLDIQPKVLIQDFDETTFQVFLERENGNNIDIGVKLVNPTERRYDFRAFPDRKTTERLGEKEPYEGSNSSPSIISVSESGKVKKPVLSENKERKVGVMTPGLDEQTIDQRIDKKEEPPTSKDEWISEILKLFDPDLVCLGQDWSLGDIREKWSGHAYEIDEAVFSLIEKGLLEEFSPGIFRRVV